MFRTSWFRRPSRSFPGGLCVQSNTTHCRNSEKAESAAVFIQRMHENSGCCISVLNAGQGNELIIKYVGGEPLKDLIPYANKADPPVFEVAPQFLWSWLCSAAPK